MGAIDDLSAGNLREYDRRLRALETATPLNHASIGAGGIRVHSGGVITIENGGLKVTGTAEIIGALVASGTITFSGQTNITGPLDIAGETTVTGTLTTNGPLHVNGATDISGNLDVDGTLDINGAATLHNDLTVTGSGKIKAGDTRINPDGTIAFGSGLSITPDNGFGDAAIMAGASQIVLTPDNPDYWAQFTGGAYFQGLVRAAALKLSSLPTTTEPANLHVDASGNVKRSTA